MVVVVVVVVAPWGRGRRTGPTRRALGVRVISGAACDRRRAMGWLVAAACVVVGGGGRRPWAWKVCCGVGGVNGVGEWSV
jgi:hypothetical protein